MTSTPTRRAKPLAPDDRREAIVDAVLPLVVAQGGHVTTRQIADAAGIAEGTIFRVFPDKRALFLAVAERAVAPPGWRESMAETVGELTTLEEKLTAVAQRMRLTMQDLMAAMTALRAAFIAEHRPHTKNAAPPRPPAFLVESSRQLLEALTELVFAPHADELRVSPRVAALALRSLVLGGMHPGAPEPAALTTELSVSILLEGVRR
jgi:AcrR family transcriptional regulator